VAKEASTIEVTRKLDQAARTSRDKNVGSSSKEFAMKVKLKDRQPCASPFCATPDLRPGHHEVLDGYGRARGCRRTTCLAARVRHQPDDPHVTEAGAVPLRRMRRNRTTGNARGDAKEKVIAGGKYAVLEYQGPIAQIGTAWDHLLGQWLPEERIAARLASDVRALPGRWTLRREDGTDHLRDLRAGDELR
jgi:hypothetical protein